MPEPITTELPKPERLTIGETPVYFTSPLEVNGQQVTHMTIRGERGRGKDGLESAVLLLKEQGRRRGEEGKSFAKPLPNVNDMEEVDWEKIDGIQYTMPDGSIHTIPKDQLSLVKPELEDLKRSHPASQGETLQEPTLARKVLETYSGEPTTLTIVGLKAYETRAHDLADRAMQLKTSLGERIWKQGFGPVYFHEKARQYYLNMLKAANSPFAEGSIKIAEAAGYNRYQDLLKNKNFLTRGSRRLIEWVKDTLGVRTLTQKFALEEIAHMRESGQIKEREAFEREGASIRKRFEMDVDNQDEYIRKTLGEDIDLLDPAKHPEHNPLVDEVKNLVRRYATGEITTKADFDKETDTLFQTHLKGGRPDLFAQAELYTSSLYEVAENLRAKAGHEGGLAAIDARLESMQVRLGMGVMGEATALEPTDVQRGSEMVKSMLTTFEKKGITLLVNEATVSSGVALALSLVVLPKMAVSGFARTVGGFAGGMAAGAIFGGVREYRQLEREYLTHLREREAGLTFAPDAKRRAWMERFFVGQRGADDLITAMSSDDVQTKLANIADAKARKVLSSRMHERNAQRVGLIQFSSRENIETQRTALDLTIAQTEKDLLASGKTSKQFLSDLTAAQTRILSEGISRVEGLSDPIKVTLGLLGTYNPEVEMLRRRFPLLGPEVATGKAQGLEDILKEFRRAARGAAVKKGLVVGATGALVGLGIRGVMEGGSEMLSRVLTKTPDLGPLADADLGPGQHFQFSQNLHLDNGNLVDQQGHAIIDNFSAELSKHAGFIGNDGQLTDAGKQWILDAAHANGYNLEIPTAVTSTVTSADVPPLPAQPVPGIAAFTDTGGGLHSVQAIIPQGTRLVEGPPIGGSGEHVYTLVDASDHHVLLRDIRMNEEGHIATVDALNRSPEAVANGIALASPAGETFTVVEAGGVGGTFPKSVADMGTEHGSRGPWGWLEEPIGGDPSISHDVPATNLTKNLFRGTFENYYRAEDHVTGTFSWDTAAHAVGEKVDYTRMGGDTLFDDVPQALFADEQIVKLGHLMDQAIDLKEVQLVDFSHDFAGLTPAEQALLKSEGVDEKTYEVLRAAYAIGRVGRVATRDEVQMFLDYLGGEQSVTLYEPTITMSGVTSTLVTNVITMAEAPPTPDFSWIPPIPILWRRPLEPYEPLIPYAPPEAPPGVPFPLLPKPSPEDHPTPFLSAWNPYGGRPEAYGPYNRRESQKYTHEEIIQYYRSRMHPDLVANPNARPDFETAARWYLKQLDPSYRTALVNLNKTIGSPMHDETQIAVCIPVRANQEEKHIYHTLEQYANQTEPDGKPLDKSKYEIVLFLNAPDKEPLDATMDEVKRFMTDRPDMPVRVATGKFPKGAVRFGAYIKYAYDLALLRALERTHPTQKDLLIATGDADLTRMDPTYLASNIAFMNDQTNAHLDAALAAQDLESRALDAYPTFKAALRFSQYQEAQVRRGVPGWNTSAPTGPSYPYVQTQGRTTVLRGSTLAAISGVNDASPAGADIELGRMINFARHGRFTNISGSDQTIAYNPETNIETNARRELVTYLSGQPITHTWSKFDEGEDVRNKSTEELIAISQEKPGTINVRELERQINAFREWDVHMNSYYTKQALGWMGLKEGVDYVVENDPNESHKGGQWQKKVTFISDLSSLASRIKDLPSEPLVAQEPPTESLPTEATPEGVPTQSESASTPAPAAPSSTQPAPPKQP